MGNQPQSTTRRITKNSRYSRNSYSLDEMSAVSKVIEKISSERDKVQPISLNNLPEFPAPVKPELTPREIQSSSPAQSLESSIKRSLSNSRANDQNDQRLAKLNQKNDELRKQLIRMSTELSTRLQKKKYLQKKKELEHEGDDANIKVPALRRELQNGYKQIDRYKKILQNLKANESPQNEQLLNLMEGKLNDVDSLIKEANNQIQASKNIEKNQQKMIKKADNESNNAELKQLKTEVQKLREKVKKFNKFQRKKIFQERLTQQYMFQLERKYREINGDYLPELKSYANKNFQPEPKYEKKKKEDLGNFKPAKWQFADANEQLRTLKQRHEQYHIRMEKALKSKTIMKQQQQKSKQQLQNAQKLLQTLHYKRDRYLQLVMGNIEFLMNEDDDDLSGSEEMKEKGFRVISKGNDVPDQVAFDDHGLIKNINIHNVKMVSVNVWYTNKHQISTIQMIYSNGKDCFMGNRTASITGDMEKEVLQVEEGDYIKNIMGSFSKKGAIEFLAFNSLKGKAKQFGKELINGLNFSLSLTKKQRPVCLSGFSFFDGTYWRINKLNIDIIFEE